MTHCYDENMHSNDITGYIVYQVSDVYVIYGPDVDVFDFFED